MSTEAAPRSPRGHALRNVVLCAMAAGAVLLLAFGIPEVVRELRRPADVAAIERLGGEVQTDPGGWTEPVISVSLNGKVGVRDTDLRHLRSLTSLRSLNLNGTSVTDAGLAHLAELKQLEVLDLEDTQVTDAGLVQLRHLGALWYLNLSGTRITDAGLAQLRSLRALRVLKLGVTRITGAGLVHLRELKGLRVVTVEGTGVTYSAARSLQRDLPGVSVTGPGSDPEGD